MTFEENTYLLNYFGGDSAISRFQLSFIDQFRKNLNPQYAHFYEGNYYEINRALTDAIRKSIEVLGAEYTLTREALLEAKDISKLEFQIEDVLTKKLIGQLSKSSLIIEKCVDPRGYGCHYRVELPVVMFDKKASAQDD